MGATEVSAFLWRERELLDLMLYKLETEQLFLTAGKTHRLQHATREVEQVMEAIRTHGLTRAVAASALAVEWGLRPEAGLRDLAAAAPAESPWGDIFAAHLAAMNKLTRQIAEVRDSNAQFLRAASRSTQETMAGVRPEAGTYSAKGATQQADYQPRMIDRTA